MPICSLYSSHESAETTLIRSILERHSITYSSHDLTKPDVAAHLRKRAPAAAHPVLVIGRRAALSATELPALEASGELGRLVAAERNSRLAYDEYRYGLAHLDGADGFRKDPFVAHEWLRRAAERGHAKGMSALATLLTTGQAGVHDETAAVKWYENSFAAGCKSAIVALGCLRLKQVRRVKHTAKQP